MFKCLADKSSGGKIKHIEGVTMHKKIVILVVLLLTFTAGISSSLASSNEWDNPNVDWRSVQQSPQSFKGWEIFTHEADLCSTFNEDRCNVIQSLRGGDKVVVLGQKRGTVDNYFKVKTGAGNVGWIDQYFVYLPLKNPNKYKLTPDQSLIRPISTTKIPGLKFTATFNKVQKQKELINLAKNTNLSFYDNTLHLLDENYTVNANHQDLGSIAFDYYKDALSISFYNNGAPKEYDRINKQGRIIIEYLLKPYFPKSYKKLAETYVKKDYKTANKLWMNGNYYKADGRWLNFGFSLEFKPK